MDQLTFEYFSQLIYRESGIVIGPQKASLLANRIQKRLRALGLSNPSEYVKIIETDASCTELVQLIDVVSTNVTFFYREERHFELYSQILADWRQEGRETFKVWCAAASSGEEPYTLAFEGAKALESKAMGLKLLATDISTHVLKKAIRAVYNSEQVTKIPEDIRQDYLVPFGPAGTDLWQVVPHISQMVLFKKLNLIEFPYPIKGPLDIIFCRNVMIYFDIETRRKIIGQFERLLRPGGYLFLSHSENLLGIQHGFSKFDVSVFRKDC